MKFDVIVADPPWKFSDKLQHSAVKRGAEDNYPVLDLEEIKKLPISEISNPNGSILALWIPSSLLQDGLDVMSAWGFNQKQTYIWVKNKKDPSIINIVTKIIPLQGWNTGVRYLLDNLLSFGMGRLFRQAHEICLIGTNSNGIYKSLQNKSQRSVSFGENLKHSAKPEHLQNSLETMFPKAKKIEIFARRQKEGWTCLGNEVGERQDIRVSIQKLIDLQNEDIAA